MYPQVMPTNQTQMSPDAPAVYEAVKDQAVDAYATAAQPAPVAPINLEPEEFKNRLMGIGGEFQASGMSKALWKMKEDQDLMNSILKNPDIVKKIADNQNPKNDTPEGVGVNAVAKAVTLTDRVTEKAKQLGINLTNGGKIPPERQGSFMDGIKQVFAESQIQPGSMEAVAQRDYFTALLSGKGVGGAMEAYGARYNQLADETRKQKMAIQNKMVDSAFEQQAMVDKYKMGEELNVQLKTDVSTRAIANMEKYRPTMVVEKDGKSVEQPISDDQLNIGKQLIERAVQTGDFETVRNRAKALGVNDDWFENALYQTQMDLARKEAALEAQTGKKASQHITAGTTMINERTGQVIQLSTLNNQPVMTDAKTGRVLRGDAQPKLTAQEGWYKIDKTAQQAGTIAASTAYGTAQGKATEAADTNITETSNRASAAIQTNNQIRDILGQGGEITGMLTSVTDPVGRAILTAAQKGLQVGSTSVSLPVEETLSALKLNDPAERDRLQVLKSLLAQKTFGAVKSAGFKGAQSDKELDAIRESIPTASNSKKAIEGMLILDDFAAKKDLRIADVWGEYKAQAEKEGVRVDYNQWARDNRDIATNPKYGTNLVEEARDKLKASMSGSAPSAPGSSGNKPTDPKQAARDAQSKTIIENELKAAQQALADAKTPEAKGRAQRDVESLEKELAKKTNSGGKSPAPVQPSASSGTTSSGNTFKKVN
jgi:hypothetical protein